MAGEQWQHGKPRAEVELKAGTDAESRVEQAVMRADLCGTYAGAAVLGREPDQRGPKATLTEPGLHHASSSLVERRLDRKRAPQALPPKSPDFQWGPKLVPCGSLGTVTVQPLYPSPTFEDSPMWNLPCQYTHILSL